MEDKTDRRYQEAGGTTEKNIQNTDKALETDEETDRNKERQIGRQRHTILGTDRQTYR